MIYRSVGKARTGVTVGLPEPNNTAESNASGKHQSKIVYVSKLGHEKNIHVTGVIFESVTDGRSVEKEESRELCVENSFLRVGRLKIKYRGGHSERYKNRMKLERMLIGSNRQCGVKMVGRVFLPLLLIGQWSWLTWGTPCTTDVVVRGGQAGANYQLIRLFQQYVADRHGHGIAGYCDSCSNSNMYCVTLTLRGRISLVGLPPGGGYSSYVHVPGYKKRSRKRRDGEYGRPNVYSQSGPFQPFQIYDSAQITELTYRSCDFGLIAKSRGHWHGWVCEVLTNTVHLHRRVGRCQREWAVGPATGQYGLGGGITYGGTGYSAPSDIRYGTSGGYAPSGGGYGSIGYVPSGTGYKKSGVTGYHPSSIGYGGPGPMYGGYVGVQMSLNRKSRKRRQPGTYGQYGAPIGGCDRSSRRPYCNQGLQPPPLPPIGPLPPDGRPPIGPLPPHGRPPIGPLPPHGAPPGPVPPYGPPPGPMPPYGPPPPPVSPYSPLPPYIPARGPPPVPYAPLPPYIPSAGPPPLPLPPYFVPPLPPLPPYISSPSPRTQYGPPPPPLPPYIPPYGPPPVPPYGFPFRPTAPLPPYAPYKAGPSVYPSGVGNLGPVCFRWDNVNAEFATPHIGSLDGRGTGFGLGSTYGGAATGYGGIGAGPSYGGGTGYSTFLNPGVRMILHSGSVTIACCPFPWCNGQGPIGPGPNIVLPPGKGRVPYHPTAPQYVPRPPGRDVYSLGSDGPTEESGHSAPEKHASGTVDTEGQSGTSTSERHDLFPPASLPESEQLPAGPSPYLPTRPRRPSYVAGPYSPPGHLRTHPWPQPYAPSGSPSYGPSGSPSYGPSGSPSYAPLGSPSYGPSGSPSYAPLGSPSYGPSGSPSYAPLGSPSYGLSGSPSYGPSGPQPYVPPPRPLPYAPFPDPIPYTSPVGPATYGAPRPGPYVPPKPGPYIPSKHVTYVPSPVPGPYVPYQPPAKPALYKPPDAGPHPAPYVPYPASYISPPNPGPYPGLPYIIPPGAGVFGQCFTGIPFPFGDGGYSTWPPYSHSLPNPNATAQQETEDTEKADSAAINPPDPKPTDLHPLDPRSRTHSTDEETEGTSRNVRQPPVKTVERNDTSATVTENEGQHGPPGENGKEWNGNIEQKQLDSNDVLYDGQLETSEKREEKLVENEQKAIDPDEK